MRSPGTQGALSTLFVFYLAAFAAFIRLGHPRAPGPVPGVPVAVHLDGRFRAPGGLCHPHHGGGAGRGLLPVPAPGRRGPPALPPGGRLAAQPAGHALRPVHRGALRLLPPLAHPAHGAGGADPPRAGAAGGRPQEDLRQGPPAGSGGRLRALPGHQPPGRRGERRAGPPARGTARPGRHRPEAQPARKRATEPARGESPDQLLATAREPLRAGGLVFRRLFRRPGRERFRGAAGRGEPGCGAPVGPGLGADPRPETGQDEPGRAGAVRKKAGRVPAFPAPGFPVGLLPLPGFEPPLSQGSGCQALPGRQPGAGRRGWPISATRPSAWTRCPGRRGCCS